jgi:hypothetical protein
LTVRRGRGFWKEEDRRGHICSKNMAVYTTENTTTGSRVETGRRYI